MFFPKCVEISVKTKYKYRVFIHTYKNTRVWLCALFFHTNRAFGGFHWCYSIITIKKNKSINNRNELNESDEFQKMHILMRKKVNPIQLKIHRTVSN